MRYSKIKNIAKKREIVAQAATQMLGVSRIGISESIRTELKRGKEEGSGDRTIIVTMTIIVGKVIGLAVIKDDDAFKGSESFGSSFRCFFFYLLL